MKLVFGVFGWLKRTVTGDRIREGDPVRLVLGPNDQRSAQYDGKQGMVTDVIKTYRGQTLYGVKIMGSDDTVYIEDEKVEAL